MQSGARLKDTFLGTAVPLNLEARAILRAFPFPFPQSSQMPSGCSCSLAACCQNVPSGLGCCSGHAGLW